jgi:DNA excision repair protein ERCC-2
MKKTDKEKLQNEYQKLIEGLREADQAREEDSFMANPGSLFPSLANLVLPDDLLKEAVPGNIRRGTDLLAPLTRSRTLCRFPETLHRVSQSTHPTGYNLTQTRMKVLHVIAETPTSFLQHVKELTFIEKKPLRYLARRSV